MAYDSISPSAAFTHRLSSLYIGRRPQRGAGMVGFLLVLIPLLSLGMGGIELAHWLSLRQTLSLALMNAARAGATRQAQPQAIADAFEQGLRQIHIQPAAQTRALLTRRQRLDTPWRIHILHPAPAAFLDHADASLSGPRRHPGQALIRNDYQAQQHARRIQQGWSQGRGPQSGLTIFQANTLLMDLWWPQPPLLPGAAAIIRILAPLHGDPIGQQMMQRGYLPFRRRIRMVMQSHPAAWSDLPDGRISHAALVGTAPPGFPPTGLPSDMLPIETDIKHPDTPPDKTEVGAEPISMEPPPRVNASEAGQNSEAPDICTP